MRVLFFTGKGGVGKSTLAASFAWHLAKNNRVKLVSLDPAHNLGDIFQTIVERNGTWVSERLLVEEVDMKEKTRAYLNKEISLMEETYSYLKVFDLDRYFSLLHYSPGIEEYALLLALEETICRSGTFNYVIFDTPPTGLTLRFLALPRITLAWIERLIMIRRRILEKRVTIAVLTDGKKKADEMSDRVMNRLVELKKQYDNLVQVLESNICGAVLVFNPDLLSVREAERLLDGLKVVGLKVLFCIQNKVREGDQDVAIKAEKEIKERMGSQVPFFWVKWKEGIRRNASGVPFPIGEELMTAVMSLGRE
ncbi:MAG: ArsA family ATPase [Syntrophales bacterium]|nr:ArsA family ATPase [Syntrophales bacterium]